MEEANEGEVAAPQEYEQSTAPMFDLSDTLHMVDRLLDVIDHREDPEEVRKFLPYISAQSIGQCPASLFEFPDTISPFHFAVWCGRTATVKVLFEMVGFDVNNVCESSGQTALHRAICLRHVAMVELLVGHPSIDVNARDCNGFTPVFLHDAWSGIVELLSADEQEEEARCLSALLSHKDVDVNFTNGSNDWRWELRAPCSVLNYLCMRCILPAVNVLLERHPYLCIGVPRGIKALSECCLLHGHLPQVKMEKSKFFRGLLSNQNITLSARDRDGKLLTDHTWMKPMAKAIVFIEEKRRRKKLETPISILEKELIRTVVEKKDQKIEEKQVQYPKDIFPVIASFLEDNVFTPGERMEQEEFIDQWFLSHLVPHAHDLFDNATIAQ